MSDLMELIEGHLRKDWEEKIRKMDDIMKFVVPEPTDILYPPPQQQPQPPHQQPPQ
eukprot:CAMPEP_0201528980 /NCGR_PEP_ID=MMETSP0161_2-20130828/40207_1 /ASSEMBLY_ACC=CAM_ASM_000251 /TAXON_ID=180227 /ORGANISM="Neoparamoeba aestuarina, Strain SoJaBio B1-5/56/2" /LENGTH=55 /DNA_ID=CAMNT_0047930549 /DNA_START=111 /DNA_END=275 /DNA_ORIENTATION=-